MLDRYYTIPILFGIFLGIIMAGVQVSATALDAAIGSNQRTALLAFEQPHPDRVDMRILGKKFSLSVPGELREVSAVPAAVRAGASVLIEGVRREVQRYLERLMTLLPETASYCGAYPVGIQNPESRIQNGKGRDDGIFIL